MKCPCCGADGCTRLSLLEGLKAQLWKVISLAAFVSAGILGQADLLGEPLKHYVSVTGTIAGVLIAWNLKQHPVSKDTL